MRKILHLPGYSITRFGKVFRDHEEIPQYISGKDNGKGYFILTYGPRKNHQVSRLVALTYIPNPNNYPFVLHIDNNRFNNYYQNLMWGTQAMNIAQMDREGRRGKAIGNLSGSIKLSVKDCQKILDSRGKITQEKLAKTFGVSRTTIQNVYRGRNHFHRLAKNQKRGED